jgi:hypothetical protein
MGDDSGLDDNNADDDKQQWCTFPDSFWRELQGQSMPKPDADLSEWLTTQDGVAIRRYGGFAPESWSGDVDGHSFKFRERHHLWYIDIDHQPSGRFTTQVTYTEPDDTAAHHGREMEVRERIASGTIDAAGYGTTTVERARFIVDTIRTYLTRQSCSHHLDRLEAIDALLGMPARWCARCGAQLDRP